VRELQTQLKAKGLYAGWISGNMGPATRRALQLWAGVTPDGVIGLQTRRAVQMKLGVPVDGVWGSQTISALQRRLNEVGI
jgi:peptidoglycan hydrolase-like protein with peptidoglycan-binding domain